MNQTIRKRWVLVALLTGVQLGCMLLGEAWLMQRLRTELLRELRGELPLQSPVATTFSAAVAVQVAETTDADLAARVDRMVFAAHVGGLSVTAGVTLLGALLATFIVRRYENRLAKQNDNLMHVAELRSRQVLRIREAVIFGLAKLAESRDDDTGEHLERIRGYVELLGRELASTMPDLDDEQVELMSVTSSLHDIGKVGIPDAVLLKSGTLTPEERAVIQKHPLIGGDCLMAIRERLPDDNFLDAACEIAFAHHERWDGGGYPFGLKGEEIPLGARIVALADVYDALTTRRVYKPAMSHEHAAEIIARGGGTQFDPQVVAAFEAVQQQFRAIAERATRLRDTRATRPAPIAAFSAVPA